MYNPSGFFIDHFTKLYAGAPIAEAMNFCKSVQLGLMDSIHVEYLST